MNKELARVIVAHICLHASMAGLRVAAPLWALKHGHSAMAVGLLFAMFAITQVFMSVPAGRFTDRHGLKKPVGMAVLVAVGVTALPVVWPSYWAFCLASLGSGAAVGVAIIALQRHVGRSATSASDLKKVFSWVGLAPAFANFVGPVVAGVLIDTAGYGWALAALACMPMATWALVRGVTEMPKAVVPEGALASGALDMLANPRLRVLLAVNWVLSSCWDVHSFMVPLIGHEHGFSASTIGLIVGSFAVAATSVRLILPLMSDQLREWKVIVGVLVFTGLLLAIYPLLSNPWAMGAGSVVMGFVLGSVQPMMLSTLHQITPSHRQGEALGLRAAVSNLSSVVMPLAFGAAGATLGASVVFWVMGAVAVSSVPLGFRMRLGAQPSDRPPDA